MKTRSGIQIEKRTVYANMGRKRTVYDAEGTLDGVTYCVLAAKSKQEAEQQALAEVAFAKANPPIESGGFSLRPLGDGGFSLRFPSGAGYLFRAPSRAAALARLADEYDHDHPVQAFVRAARDEVQ